MGCCMSRFVKATIAVVLLVMIFMSGATAATSFDATKIHQLPLADGLLQGPESITFDAQGHDPYSGVFDGRDLRWNGDKIGWTTYAYGPGYDEDMCRTSIFCPATSTESQCGRLLGLQFHHKFGDLYVAYAYKGLMRVGPGGGEATLLVNAVDDLPLRFTNGVDIDQVTGQVYFTDSSMKYDRTHHEMVTRSGDSTGRLMRYDPRTGDVAVLQTRLAYANGVAISTNRTHLIVASTGPCKLLRHWIKGSKTGTCEPFVDLPSYLDNVRPERWGGYWVALHGEKNELPSCPNSHLLAVRIGADGEILEEMRGPSV
uniref:Strictosidine synthase 1 n=1 Tax=Aegilops tauschii TaxID=37682 RepID=R7WBL7_AEGTA